MTSMDEYVFEYGDRSWNDTSIIMDDQQSNDECSEDDQ